MKKKRYSKTTATGAVMADIAMLLIIFFMVTTTAESPKGVQVDLPAAATEGAEKDSFYISITKGGKYFFDTEEIFLQDLPQLLANRLYDKDKTVVIIADKNIMFKEVNAVLNILQQYEFLNILFMAYPENSRQK